MSKPEFSSDLMYRLLVQGVKDYAIYLLGRDGTVLNWNAGAERAKGYTAEDIVGRNYACFYSQEDQAKGVPQHNLDLALREGHFATEGWRFRKDGSAFWASVALDVIRDEAGALLGFAKVTRDLSEQREATRRFEHQAIHDPMTGLLNRVGLGECLDRRLARIDAEASLALHVVDLNRFKPINDTFGHQAGDEALRQVARRLEAMAGPSGIVGRLGGDEFAVLQSGAPSVEAVEVMASAIVDCVALPLQIGSTLATVGASVGVAIAPRDGADAATLLRNADLAVHAAKSKGRNRARLFDPAMGELALSRNLLELKLRHAVAARDFRLAYQPVVDGRSGRVLGFEALLRWDDQTGRSMSPASFIPLAEELGLMPELGEWVLQRACETAANWPVDLVVAVNLSPAQLKQEGLADLVASILGETGLPARRLELEITETALLGDLDSARRVLSRLRDLGVGIALDDFGTGFSSLSLARELPLTRIKIDRSFVADIDETQAGNAIVDSVLALCRGYGLATTAEGVETEHQRAALIAAGCHDLQGYLFGRPAPIESWRSILDPAPLLAEA
ncbi:EAL domain-containing protein [Aureimonas ureilytica]|uniref:EAL domain-containing protein n=1 Tax=Aureimonas ureilytica TaxID=401562 RepID=UPI000362C752|nr:EAL domain-containing protein [Aureimonas ureilytica]